jgi:hypothetical protein
MKKIIYLMLIITCISTGQIIFGEQIKNDVSELKIAIEYFKTHPDSDGGGENILHLIRGIEKSRNPEAIPLLIQCIGIASNAGTALAAIGEPSINPLIEEYNKKIDLERKTHKSEHIKSSILYAFGDILAANDQAYPVSAESKRKIKHIIIKELNSFYYIDRIAALSRIQYIEDVNLIPVIKKLAKKDPYYYNHPKKGKQYSVREAAQRALRKIEEKQKQSPDFNVKKEPLYFDMDVGETTHKRWGKR